jgi:hypothetical protein
MIELTVIFPVVLFLIIKPVVSIVMILLFENPKFTTISFGLISFGDSWIGNILEFSA